VSRITYSELFSIIGTTFGAGDGVSTFNLPNYVDRMPMGAGNLYPSGSTGGSRSASLPNHSHAYAGVTQEDGLHSHVVNKGNSPSAPVSGALTSMYFAGTNNTNPMTSVAGSHSHFFSGRTLAEGNAPADSNLPPYFALNFIIKT
jgi:microcystin-dependent protein